MCNCHLLEHNELAFGIPDRLRCRGRCPSVHTAGPFDDCISALYSDRPSEGPAFSDVTSESESAPASSSVREFEYVVEEDGTERVASLRELAPIIDSPLYATPYAHPIWLRNILGRLIQSTMAVAPRLDYHPRAARRLQNFDETANAAAAHRDVLENLTNRHVASLEGLNPEASEEDALEYVLRAYEVRQAANITYRLIWDLVRTLASESVTANAFSSGQLSAYEEHLGECFVHLRALDEYLDESLNPEHPLYRHVTWTGAHWSGGNVGAPSTCLPSTL